MSSLTDKTNIQWFPGHMTKTLRQIEKDIKNVDVVLMLLDARIPLSSMNPELEKLTASKPKIYLLNKADLADPAVTEAWIRALKKEESRAISLSSKTKGSVPAVKAQISLALKELLFRRAEKGMQGAKVRALVCGIPNVGKSTFINTFAGAQRAKAADKPGVTRGKQWISTEQYDLLDVPGVLWKKFESHKTAMNLAFIGSIKDDLLDTEEIAGVLLDEVRSHYGAALLERYKLTEDMLLLSGLELLEQIAKKRGMLMPGGIADTQRASVMVLDEFRASKLGRITLERPEE